MRRSHRSRRRGQVSLEWIILFTALVIGVIGGLGVARNAILSELNDIAEATQGLNLFPPPPEETEE